jgi:hypothetical protein
VSTRRTEAYTRESQAQRFPALDVFPPLAKTVTIELSGLQETLSKTSDPR